MNDCNNCKHKDCWEYADPCDSCTNITGEPTNWEPQTRADRVRTMTDEELAEFLAEYRCAHKAPHCMEANCAPCWLDWLRQEAD